MAERTVMVMSAEKAAEKTRRRGWRIAINAATRNVLSPISENRIMVKERNNECIGLMTFPPEAGPFDVPVPAVGVL